MKREYNWELKDASRGYWDVIATERGKSNPNPENHYDPGFYETYWDVTIKTQSYQPKYAISFQAKSDYDEPLRIYQIAHYVHEHIMLFYDACILESHSPTTRVIYKDVE